jgi:hypothetical protein
VNWRVMVFRAIARLNTHVSVVPRLSGRREAFVD